MDLYLIAFALLGFTIGWTMRGHRSVDKDTTGCNHHYDSVAIEHISEMAPGAGDDDIPRRRFTNVLKVCAWCNRRTTEEVDGHWTLEQIRGLNPTARVK